MQQICVLNSPIINKKDTIILNSESVTYSLNDINDLDSNVIVLYMYQLAKFQQHGIKVGMTVCHSGETFLHSIEKRIKEQKNEVALNDEQYEKFGLEREVVFWGICLDAKNDNFKDYKIHKEIMKKYSGIVDRDQEWFRNVPLDDLVEVFKKYRTFKLEKEIYTPRKEQKDCIEALKAYFNEHPKGERFLLNCKMRFGKCFTTYKYAEEANINKILILTFVPAVESSWRDDLSHIEKDYDCFTDNDLKKEKFSLKDRVKPFVIFLSLQNYLGKEKNNDVKSKIKKLEEVNFDLVVLDEYHFGAWNSRTQETFEDVDKSYQNELSKTKNKDLFKRLSITTDKTICLSGTPFRVLARGEFNVNNTYTYSYFDEQKNKYPTENKDVINDDYEEFPDMKILGYNMTNFFSGLNLLSDEKILGKKYFSLNQFFATQNDENYALEHKFIYEEEIKMWLEIIKGASFQGRNFPYSNPLLKDYVKHTLWLMPTVSSCIAITELLNNDNYFSRYEIINLSAPEIGAGNKALEYLNNGMTKAENTGKLGSIAITVNKLTIGVTVKKWFSIFVLKDLSSPEQYFQSIFRIQTPFVDRENCKVLKKDCFVYDFNIDRASALLLKYAKQYESENSQYEKLKISKLIVKYLPIYINGDLEHPISEEVFYQLAEFGDTSRLSLSRKIRDIGKTTRAYDDEIISEMLNDPNVSEVIKNVFAHAKFNKPKNRTAPSQPDDDFDKSITKEGLDCGYNLGYNEYEKFIDLDSEEIQNKFEDRLNSLCAENNHYKEGTNEFRSFNNGFKKGYERGVNAPVKKLNCGKNDGQEFVNKVKEAFGTNIKYTKETSSKINNFIHHYLNDDNNIPKEYKGALYSRWYKDSFKRACQTLLKPVVNVEKGQSVEDAENVLQHILSRLFEFLYISVYRETSFDEVFLNANPNVFLEAVGITKEDFDVLNKYKIFQKDVLDNYIHEFFMNESLGEKLDLTNEEIKKQYRNSFDWFGYGIEKSNN